MVLNVKVGLSVSPCVRLQPPMGPRLAQGAGSFLDPPAERNGAEAKGECKG